LGKVWPDLSFEFIFRQMSLCAELCVDLTNRPSTNSRADIVMNTTKCSPFESFAKQDIELWVVIGEPSNATSQGDAAILRYDCVKTPISVTSLSDTHLDYDVSRHTADRDVHIRKVAKVLLDEPEPPSGADDYDDYGHSYDQDLPNMEHERGEVSTRSQICCSSFSWSLCGMLSNLSSTYIQVVSCLV